ncbi:hypothetical protein, partial [Enterococcus faecalis]|uniref:hypothetical protein n=1 Tax=Enterococcus faecalis TaxID=1351 RepID=UPI0035D6223C
NEIKLSIMFTPPFGAVAKTSISQEEFLVGVVRACPDRLQGAILTRLPETTKHVLKSFRQANRA